MRKAAEAAALANVHTVIQGETEFTIVRRSGYPVQVVGERMWRPNWPLRDCAMTDGPVRIAMGVVSAALDRQQAVLERRGGLAAVADG